MRDHVLDVIKVTPNHLMALTSGKRARDLATLLPRKWTILGGEALRPDIARDLLAAGTCRVLNHYGPTETTVGVCTFEAPLRPRRRSYTWTQTVPVGDPWPTRAHT